MQKIIIISYLGGPTSKLISDNRSHKETRIEKKHKQWLGASRINIGTSDWVLLWIRWSRYINHLKMTISELIFKWWEGKIIVLGKGNSLDKPPSLCQCFACLKWRTISRTGSECMVEKMIREEGLSIHILQFVFKYFMMWWLIWSQGLPGYLIKYYSGYTYESVSGWH